MSYFLELLKFISAGAIGVTFPVLIDKYIVDSGDEKDFVYKAVLMVLLVSVVVAVVAFSWQIVEVIPRRSKLLLRNIRATNLRPIVFVRRIPFIGKYFKYRLAVLFSDQIVWKDEHHPWVNIPPQKLIAILAEVLPSERFSVGGINIGSNLVETQLLSSNMIVNPYGELYPEVNLQRQISLDEIFKYISGGGSFFNVAGIPGYYNYDFQNKRRLDSIEPTVMPDLSLRRHFHFTPMLKRLGLDPVNTELTPSFWNGVRIKRAVKWELNIKPLVWVADVVVAGSAFYGKGRLLFSMFDQNDIKRETYLKLLKELILDNVE